MGFGEHRRVVVGVAGGHDLEIKRLLGLDRLALLFGHAQMVVDHDAGRIGF